MLFKLFVVMGVSFIFEIISSAVNFNRNEAMQTLEIIFDSFNNLQGEITNNNRVTIIRSKIIRSNII